MRKLPLVMATAASLALLAQMSSTALADSLHVTDDAYIETDDPGKNRGDEQTVKVRDDLGDKDRVGFARFDLSPLPTGTTAADIVKATLRLLIESVREPGTFEVESADDPWDEGSLTAINQPGTGTDFMSGSIAITEADEGSYVTVDVTSLVKKWFDVVPLDNNGIALRPFDGLRMKVGAKEGDEAHAMEIEVVLDTSPGLLMLVRAPTVLGTLTPAAPIATVTALCSAPTPRVVSGGHKISVIGSTGPCTTPDLFNCLEVTESRPNGSNTGWTVTGAFTPPVTPGCTILSCSFQAEALCTQ